MCLLIKIFVIISIRSFTIESSSSNRRFYNNTEKYAIQHGSESIVVNNNFHNRLRRSVFLLKQNSSEKYILQSNEKPATNRSQVILRPKFFKSTNINQMIDPGFYKCREKYENVCRNRTKIFRNRIINGFRKSINEIVNEENYYHVEFESSLRNYDNNRDYPAACMLLNANVKVLRRRDTQFGQLSFGKLFPKRKLFKGIKHIRNCAIVSSAGSLVNSGLGKFIDLHDIVMRFNHAPIEGYEIDVGRKTTIRVVNSQVVTKTEFNFVDSKTFQNITIAAWDPGKYNGLLKDWIQNADFDLFTNYDKYRKKYPKSNAYLIDPNTIWKLWENLQIFTKTPLRKNPPSSGFIGLALILPYCPYVDFIEYIPSTRLNGRCHYYSNEMNSACTFGAWHPLAAEKLMTLEMNVADDYAVFQNGVIRIRRPDNQCGDSNPIENAFSIF